jgi:DNA replication protein DnaC
MTPFERLRTTLTTLNLTAIDGRLETLLERAAKKEPSYADFLLEAMSTEADARKQRYVKTRLQLAHLPYVKTFDQFDSWLSLWPRRRFSPARLPLESTPLEASESAATMLPVG